MAAKVDRKLAVQLAVHPHDEMMSAFFEIHTDEPLADASQTTLRDSHATTWQQRLRSVIAPQAAAREAVFAASLQRLQAVGLYACGERFRNCVLLQGKPAAIRQGLELDCVASAFPDDVEMSLDWMHRVSPFDRNRSDSSRSCL